MNPYLYGINKFKHSFNAKDGDQDNDYDSQIDIEMEDYGIHDNSNDCSISYGSKIDNIEQVLSKIEQQKNQNNASLPKRGS